MLLLPFIAIPLAIVIRKKKEVRDADVYGNRIRKADKLARKYLKGAKKSLGQKEAVYAKEPKIRDSFLQVLFDHANIGGFDGAFTNANNLDVLRGALREIAQKDVGEQVIDVLIAEIARQDY